MLYPRGMIFLLWGFLLTASVSVAQITYPENGVADQRTGHYAFTNATIVKDAATTLTNATEAFMGTRKLVPAHNLHME